VSLSAPLSWHFDRKQEDVNDRRKGGYMGIVATSQFDARTFLIQAGPGTSVSSYAKGQTVFAQGDPADAVFYLWKGKISITALSENGKRAAVAMLKSGDFFGEGCLAGQLLRTATVRTLMDSRILRIDKAAMIRAIRDEPAFSWVFMSHLLVKSIRTEEDLIDQLLNSSEKRLARRLVLLADSAEAAGQEPVIDKISQELLAAMVGTTRSRVSFFMNKFRRLGFIDYNGNDNLGLRVRRSLRNVVARD
jgi:CRP/FNR family transcriptional regulator, cyclic AMP receptor protein